MKRIIGIISCAILSANSTYTLANEQESIADLRAQIAELSRRLEALESARQVQIEDLSALKSDQDLTSWAGKTKVSGDFRYRYEDIDDQRRAKTRDRNRIRARVAVAASVTDKIEVGLGVASGSTDPISTNQTLGGAATTKGLNLDLAYFKWRLTPQLSFSGGKTKNPIYAPEKSQLMWDGDLRPEGIFLAFDNGTWFAHAHYSFLESDNGSNGTADTGEIYSFQTGYRADFGSSKLILGASYTDIPISGKPSFLDGDCELGSSDCFGNTMNNDGTFAFDFREIEGFAEWRSQAGTLPLTLFGQYVQNLDAKDEDTGYSAGIKVGKAKSPGSWEVSYLYRALEADATLGMFSDSDFAGGGTDNEGHVFKASVALAKNTKLSATYFLTEYGEHRRGRTFDYDRLQVDLSFKY